MRQRLARPTIKEVASAAGVSTQTISRVINERPDVSAETRKRVQKVIKELGYRPSALARSLIRQRSHTLGIVTAGLEYLGPSRVLSGIAAAAERAGYSLLIKELPRFDENEIEPIFQALLSRHVDGIIWAVPEVGENHLWIHDSALDLNVPLVYLTMEPQENISVVAIDNYQGGRMAMSHLIEQGYRNIGHMSGPLDWWEARQRMAGWKDALIEAGLEVGDHHCVEGNWSPASGGAAIETLLDQYPEMDAIFVGNDQMALGAIHFANQRGLRVPEDIGIVGFDDIVESAFFSPALTTIQQDQYNIAKLAVEEILKIIESEWHGTNQVEPQSVLLPPTLVVRQSSLRGNDRR
jgi:DNA-binding LacI/PurR family transcriptional regulator